MNVMTEDFFARVESLLDTRELGQILWRQIRNDFLVEGHNILGH